MVAGRSPSRVPVAPARLVPGLADRCTGPAPRPPAARAAPAAGDRADRQRTRRRARGVVARRRAHRGDGQPTLDDLDSSRIAVVDVATGKSEVVAGQRSHDTGASW